MKMERVRVSDVLKLVRRPVHVDPLQEYRLIRIYSFGKGIFHSEPKSGAELGNYRFFRVETGDLVLSNIGAWEGGFGVATKVDMGLIGNHRVLTYVPIEQRIDTAWARWFFLSEPGLALIRKAAPGTTMRNRTLAIDRFEALEIPLPSLDEQRWVAQRLDRLSAAALDLTQRSKHANDLSEAFATSASLRPDLDEDTKVQAGWRQIRLSEVLSVNKDEINVEFDGNYRIAGVLSFGRGLFERQVLTGAQTSYRKLNRLRAGQLVMSRLKAWEGALGIVPPELDGSFVSPEFPTFDVDIGQVESLFLEAVLTSESFWSRLRDASRGIGARRERVGAEKLLDQLIEVPPLDEQKAIAEMLKLVQAAESLRKGVELRAGSLVPAALNKVFAGLS